MSNCCKYTGEDVVEQILSTLPPKSLMRFKCVSKRWYALITNPIFVAKHLSYSKHNSLTTSVLLKRLVCKDTKEAEDHEPETVLSFVKFRNNIDDNGGKHAHEHNSYSGVEDVKFLPKTSSRWLHIVGHCDGIVCLAATHEVLLWNPAIQESKPLSSEPYLQGYGFNYDAVAFGYDPCSKGYKVVKIGCHGDRWDDENYYIYHPPKAILYTHLGTDSDSWREIETCSLETQTTILWPEIFQIYFKNVCYWTGQEQHKELHAFEAAEEKFIHDIIIFFDLVDEVFHDMFLPDCFYDRNEFFYGMRLLVWNESVSLFGLQNTRHLSCGIWVMDELGGPKGAWTKHIAFELTEKPLVFLNNDQILLADVEEDTIGHIISYNLSTKKLNHLPIQTDLHINARPDDDYIAVLYVNSIVPVLGGNMIGSGHDISNVNFLTPFLIS
ncbi:F-box/kelch-repeat protein At3g06240-like [Argentina anserina]|uniref:F-box/kelch-repeat protein At3g06240-like n=1 Tax=Argentina anserina TaxID=57926 RepID=UPI00217692FA|nr:F-box/kelch-repeat protein At3g06240-like [Potentilla anserina]